MVYAAGFDPESITFSSLDDLLEIDFVKSHTRQAGFYRYSLNRSSGTVRNPLLAEYQNGKKWFVIGFIEGDISLLDLPDWKNIQLS